jgi:hypothetical protein
MLSYRGFLAVLLSGVLLWLAGCVNSAAPTLVFSGGPFADGGPPHDPPNTVYVSGGLLLCVKNGPVTVRAIRPARTSSGFDFSGWGSRPQRAEGTGNAPGPLSEYDFTPGPVTETHLCGSPFNLATGVELAFQSSRTDAATEWMQGLNVTYTSKGHHAWILTIPLTLGLCGTTTTAVTTAARVC